MYCPINEKTACGVWRLWYLKLGGIHSPLVLAELTGLPATFEFDKWFELAADGFFWGGKDPVALPAGKSVVCGRCDAVCTTVPCQRCELKGLGPDWKTTRDSSTVGDYITPAEQAVRRVEAQYEG